ncbi:MAG TPA: LacI family DNA-binding transcriptional regulator [Woeseiaceae bacterium]|nr:LacI family DNA-binding transcriptional regulator [Woeseiaceae bacterium]
MTETPKRRRRRSAPTLGDVARHAGVSSMTVSRVINRASTVREETRRVVYAAIQELGYLPNEAARRLAGAKQMHVALLYAKPSAFIAELMFGGLETARKHDAQFIIEKCEQISKTEQEIERILSEGADGFVIAPPLADSDHVLDFIQASGIPAVVVSSSRVRDSVCAVGIDAYAAARDVTEHLIALGHRRIGFIAGHPKHATSALRLAGYRDGLRDAGLECCDELIAPGDFTYRSGLDAAEDLLSVEPPPTALFASNDDMAAAAAAVAHRRGLDVPADLSVCGFDDTPLATAVWPQLTTIHIPIAELSRAAVDLLVELMRDKQVGEHHAPRHVVLDYKLIRRQSDAPPRRRRATAAAL